MIDRRLPMFVLPALLLLATVVFCTGITWGLPGRGADPYLFGGHPVWTGRQMLDLAGGWGDRGDKGADVDSNPLVAGNGITVLNATDAERAAIVIRYRLYSHQPDEMITFRALSEMRPGQLALDPKLYQYGGLWIYPVGAMLKIGSILGLIELRTDVAYYIDHPESFARFYVAARLYSAAWGVFGAWVVFAIVGKLTKGKLLPPLAVLMYIFMPVVVNMAHEAKPHLAGAVLMLLAVWSAARYVETGARGRAIVTGVLCGAAWGMLISAVVVFAILPLMTLLRPDPWHRRIGIALLAIVCGSVVYAMTNPYVPIHLIEELLGLDTPLVSNLANSRAMYHAGDSTTAIVLAARWLAAGMTTPLAGVAGGAVLFGIGLSIRRRRLPPPMVFLLSVPAGIVLIQFVLLAAGKPGEYARFALFPDVAMVILLTAELDRWAWSWRWQFAIGSVLIVCAAVVGIEYVKAFSRDSRPETDSRLMAARTIRDIVGRKSPTAALPAEPAPYSCPPVNLFDWRLILPSKDNGVVAPADLTIVVQQDDRPITWASKGFGVVNALSGMFDDADR